MQNYLIKNITIVNEGSRIHSDVYISNGRIQKIGEQLNIDRNVEEINGSGKYLLPGCIDDQVHFREPGLTHKATIATESRAAVAGGVTSFMEMPNTIPPVFTQDLLEQKYDIASASSVANYSFFMGTSNENPEDALRTNEKRDRVCGIKIFMGSSTGGLLVNSYLTLDKLFSEAEVLIATHCEDERIIRSNLEELKRKKIELEPIDHPAIRNEDACFQSSFAAVQLAKKHNSRLHILHISTDRELQLFSNMLPLAEKRITAEVCVHHLHFSMNDYDDLGNLIKCNPAIKAPFHRLALWDGLLDNRLDVIATDHAPHTWEEKNASYEKAHAGLPLVQHSLLLMLYYAKQGKLTLERVVEKMAHAPAICFRVADRGFIREGYYADLVVVDLENTTVVTKSNILYKCGWSPLENFRFPASIEKTFVNGNLVYDNGTINDAAKGERLAFQL
jgi:dihydroorotase